MRIVSRPLLLICLSLALSPALAQSSDLPSQIRLVVPFAPGGGLDIIARLVGQQIAADGGPTLVIDNRPGASTAIGASIVARAKPDGATILTTAGPSFLSLPQIRKINFDPLADFEPICVLVNSPQVIAVNGASPIQTIEDLVAAARKSPGTVAIGANGPFSTHHMAIQMLQKITGTTLLYVPYAGEAPSINALLGNQVVAIVANYATIQGQVTSGAMRVLAITGSSHIPSQPNIPTLRERHIDFDVTTWFAVWAPAKTPAALLDKLAGMIETALQSPDLQRKYIELQLEPVHQCRAAFDAYQRQQSDLVRQIARDAGWSAN